MASTALYQIWAGTKQKELGAGSMQVLPSPIHLRAPPLSAASRLSARVLFCQLLWPPCSFPLGAPAH